ncbi:MAG: perosamine synthetase [Oceanotoga sp.]|uniref:DegT/DnrJ/EryC1/StrS family aminotransferase n=1 Tax=Oceanotoga sp. TaxID=2108366 RepID=UPI0026558A80|nr:DegT/DnrJ/EryC1/StrS family aminotransferase [Oceanotoga sp.]MDN5341791.1 perosamine synthetase [Oceanotoga sp.]
MKVPLSSPDITDFEINFVNDVLKSNQLALGPYLNMFEEKIKKYFGVKYAIAVNSGTSALHLILKAMEFKRGDKLITTPFTFISSSNVALYENGIVEFVDIDKDDYNISIPLLNKKLKDLDRAFFMGVDIFGQSLDWDSIDYDKNKIFIIEDSCEAIGAEYKGKKVGTFGKAGTFAFYPNKQITTGEGGIVITDCEDIYKKCKSMSNQGRGDDMQWLEHVRIGFNYRMDEMSAALGYGQMIRLDEILKKRSLIAENYYDLFSEEKRIVLPKINNFNIPSWFVFVIRLDLNWVSNFLDLPEWIINFDFSERIESDKRDMWSKNIFKVQNFLNDFINKLTLKGVQCKNYFKPVHTQKFYREKFGFEYGDFPITELISSLTIAIPFFTNLTFEEQVYVFESIKEVLGEMEV